MTAHRVKLSVSEGGHNIPRNVIKRRYQKGWYNMNEKISYSKLAITAMFRAAEKNLKMPIWQDGKIIYLEYKKDLNKKLNWTMTHCV